MSCKRCVQVVQLRKKRWFDFDQAGGRFQTELCNAKAWSPTLHFEVWRRRGLSRSVKFARVLGCSEETEAVGQLQGRRRELLALGLCNPKRQGHEWRELPGCISLSMGGADSLPKTDHGSCDVIEKTSTIVNYMICLCARQNYCLLQNRIAISAGFNIIKAKVHRILILSDKFTFAILLRTIVLHVTSCLQACTCVLTACVLPCAVLAQCVPYRMRMVSRTVE